MNRTPSKRRGRDGAGVGAWRRWVALGALVVAVLGGARGASGQAPAGTRAGGLTVEVDAPGVGGFARASSLVGVRVRITDTSATRRNVAVRLVMRDSDGDYFAPARLVPLTPNLPQPVWVYTWLPPDVVGRSLMLGVYPIAGDGGLEEALLDEPLARIDLGDARSAKGRALSVSDPGVVQVLRVGNAQLGLSRYFSSGSGGQSSGGITSTTAAAMQFLHEPMQLLAVRSAAELPDNWMGLGPVSVMVWGEGEPAELKGAYAQAVREWLYHGGHLVVVLPSAGQTWLGVVNHELADLMPEVDAVRRDGADLSPYVPLLTRQTSTPPAEALRGVVYDLRPRAGSSADKAVRVLAGPAGDTLVVRRGVGSGAVTVVGLDLTRQSALSVDADVFWHRVLGTRGQLLNPVEASGAVMNSSRGPLAVDAAITTEVTKGEQAQAAVWGVFLGLVVFAVYWVAAGPGSYAVLRKMGSTRHAWVVFTGMAGVFTVIAWGGAWMTKPHSTEGTHVTLYEHVFGQPITRSRTFLSVMLPWYGEARVGVGGMDGRLQVGAKATLRNVVLPWTTGEDGAGSDGAFPDTRDYTLDMSNPSTLAFPVRSTVKQLQVEWAGGTLWRTPYPVTDAGEPGGEVRVEVKADGKRRLVGSLKHDMPGDLENVTVMYVGRQRRVAAKPGFAEGWQPVVGEGWVVSMTGVAGGPAWTWKPGVTLDLAKVEEVALSNISASAWSAFLDSVVKQSGGLGIETPRLTMPRMMEVLTAMGQLGVPRVDEKQRVSEEQKYQAVRRWTQGWDASRWMTQPCVIILGEVKGASATPLFVDGKEMVTKGSTWVRWVYPLGSNPPAWPVAGEAETAGGEGGGAGQDTKK